MPTSEKLKSGKPRTCPKCWTGVVEAVHRKKDGSWYIGTWCSCGTEPYSIEAEGYTTREEADEELKEGTYGQG